MANFDELKEAYEEVIEVMNLTETVKGKKVPVSVPKDADEDYLKDKLVIAVGMIEPGDKFTEETQAVLDEFAEPAAEEVKPVRGAKAGKATKAAKEEVAEGDAPVEKKPKGKKPEKAGEPGKPGIIATIRTLLKESGPKGLSKEQIVEELLEAFPGRDATSLKNTCNVQIPSRINKECDFKIEKLENGNYRKVVEK